MNHNKLLEQWAKEREEIYKLSLKGVSIRDIAKRYGVTDTAILLRLNRYKKANILPKSILKATKGKVERLELKD